MTAAEAVVADRQAIAAIRAKVCESVKADEEGYIPDIADLQRAASALISLADAGAKVDARERAALKSQSQVEVARG